MRLWRVNWIVVAAIIVHIGWGIVLLFSSRPLMTTPMAEVPWNVNQYTASFVYLTAAGLAASHIVWRKLDQTYWGLVTCLPQQFLLMTSALTALRCVLRGSYADGVPRPWEFIFCDQLWTMVGMTVHTITLLDWYWFSRMKKGNGKGLNGVTKGA